MVNYLPFSPLHSDSFLIKQLCWNPKQTASLRAVGDHVQRGLCDGGRTFFKPFSQGLSFPVTILRERGKATLCCCVGTRGWLWLGSFWSFKVALLDLLLTFQTILIPSFNRVVQISLKKEVFLSIPGFFLLFGFLVIGSKMDLMCSSRTGII